MAQVTTTTELENHEVTTKFGLNQVNNPTPMWVTWVFRVQFVMNKAVGIWLSSTGLIPVQYIKEVFLALNCFDLAVWGLGKFVGVEKKDYEI